MRDTEREIASQPECWTAASDRHGEVAAALPAPGERLLVLGCGTSFHVARAFAALRERAGHGETDAAEASELPARRYDRVLAISRSGTTTEVLDALRRIGGDAPRVAITAVADTPVARAADDVVVLAFADERSVVQTRYATTVLALLRRHLGEDLAPVAADGRRALEQPLPADLGAFERFVFLGRGWTASLAHEAALKLREGALAWTEAYTAMEYRHGPMSASGPRTLTWALGDAGDVLADAERTGATVVAGVLDPLAELVRVQRAAVALAAERGLDIDRPPHLERSVVLEGATPG